MIRILPLLALCLVADAAERIPGTKVTIEPPAGFTPSADFNGYHMESTGASIIVSEIPGPYAEVRNGMTRENLGKGGAKVISIENVNVGEVKGLLIQAEREEEGDVYGQWILVFGNETSVLLNATAPRKEFAELSDSMKKCLLATKWEPGIKIGMLEGLPYTVNEAGDLKFAFKMQHGLVLSRDGAHPVRDLSLPMVMMNAIADDSFNPELDAKTYAHALLGQLAKVPEQRTIVSEGTIEMHGMNGYQIVATARPDGAQDDISYRISLAPTHGWIYLQYCRVGKASFAEYEPTFDAILKSFSLRKK